MNRKLSSAFVWILLVVATVVYYLNVVADFMDFESLMMLFVLWTMLMMAMLFKEVKYVGRNTD